MMPMFQLQIMLKLGQSSPFFADHTWMSEQRSRQSRGKWKSAENSTAIRPIALN